MSLRHLYDRHDIHEAREHQGESAVAPPVVDLSAATNAVRELERRITQLQESLISEVAHGGSRNEETTLDNWPIAGARRLVARDRSHGNASLAVPAQTAPMTPIVPAEPYRAGGEIVNSGANPCTLVLVDAQGSSGPAPSGVAAIWLTAGGSWDFRLGAALWCGPVAAFAAGATTLTVALI